MKQKNYVAPSISERASRIRTSILAGSSDNIHSHSMPWGDARQRTAPTTPSDGKVNEVLSF